MTPDPTTGNPDIDPFLRIKDMAATHFSDYVIIAKYRMKDGKKIKEVIRYEYSEPFWAHGAMNWVEGDMAAHAIQLPEEPINEQET